MKVVKKKCLGIYNNPEQFLELNSYICPFDDSLKVYDYLIKNLGLPRQIKVLPVEIVVESNEKAIPLLDSSEDRNYSYIFWAAMDLEKQKVYTFVPAFHFENFEQFLKDNSFVNINLLDHDMYFVWKNEFYAVIYTSTGEAVIRKVNGIWSEFDVRALISIRESHLVFPSIHPVNLFSISEHKFICSAWSIDDAERNCLLWYTIQWDDEDILKNYDASDLMEFPLDVEDVTKAGDVRLKVCYSREYGFYLSKTNQELPDYIVSNKYKKEAKKHDLKEKIASKTKTCGMCIELKPEFKEEFKLRENQNCKILEMYPAKNQSEN